MKIQILATLAFIALSTSAFAGNPKGETKDAKDAKVEASKEKTSDEVFTYYVNGQTSTHYTLTTTPQASCGSGVNFPCKIESEEPLSSPILKSEVDTNPDVDIIERRQSL